MASRYQIVFSGELVPGKAVEEIIAAFSKRFRVKEQTARAVVTAPGRQVLKRHLEPERAERYRIAFRKVGLVVGIEPAGPSLRLEPREAGGRNELSALPVPPTPVSEAWETLTLQSRELDPNGRIGLDARGDEGGLSAGVPDPVSQWNESQLELMPNEPGEEAANEEDGHTACPKCGAPAVSPVDGICQACGVVAERYLARLAAETGDPAVGPDAGINPYAPPQADLTQRKIDDTEEFLSDPQSVAAGRGWGWLREGWEQVKESPGGWIGAVLLYGVVSMILGWIPFLGPLASTILGPTFSAGFMIGANAQSTGSRFKLEHLFAGFSRHPGRLVLLGLVYIGAIIAILLVASLFAGLVLAVSGGGASLESFDPSVLDPGFAGVIALLVVLIFAVLVIPLAMAMLFSPALIALNDSNLGASLKRSFVGCWRNILPFTVFGLAAMGLAVLCMLPAVLLAALTGGGILGVILGVIPTLVAFLMLTAVLIMAVYLAYRDIYYR